MAGKKIAIVDINKKYQEIWHENINKKKIKNKNTIQIKKNSYTVKIVSYLVKTFIPSTILGHFIKI